MTIQNQGNIPQTSYIFIVIKHEFLGWTTRPVQQHWILNKFFLSASVSRQFIEHFFCFSLLNVFAVFLGFNFHPLTLLQVAIAIVHYLLISFFIILPARPLVPSVHSSCFRYVSKQFSIHSVIKIAFIFSSPHLWIPLIFW